MGDSTTTSFNLLPSANSTLIAFAFERVGLEQNVVEAQGLRGQYRGVTHLALDHHQRQSHRACSRVAGGPALARTRVRRMAISAQALTVDPGQRHRVDEFVA